MRRAARTDDNHVDIVRAFEKYGCAVLQLHAVGQGCPDLLVAFGEAMVMVEVKTKTGKLTAQQRAFTEKWPPGFVLVRDADDVFGVSELLRAYHHRLTPPPDGLN